VNLEGVGLVYCGRERALLDGDVCLMSFLISPPYTVIDVERE